MFAKVVRSISNKILNMAFSKKLLVSYILLFTIPIVSIGTLSYIQLNQQTLENVVKYSNQTLVQTGKNVDRRMKDIIDSTTKIGSSPLFNNLTQAELKDQYTQYILEHSFLDNIFPNILGNDTKYVISMHISGGNGVNLVFPYDDINSLHFKLSDIYLIPQEIQSDKLFIQGRPFWGALGGTVGTEQPEAIVYVQNIISREFEYLGTVILKLDPKLMSEIYDNISNGTNDQMFVLNDQNEVMTPNAFLSMGETFDAHQEGYNDDYIFNEVQLRETGWRLIHLISLDTIRMKINNIRNVTIIISVTILLASAFFSMWLSKAMSAPIKRLIISMRHVEREHFNFGVQVNSYGELRMLETEYNKMVIRLRDMMKELRIEQQKQRESELKALQAQINPHFLYNTLNAIHWMAVEFKAEPISRMVNSLSRLFRLSLNQGKEFIEIGKELEHFRCYMEIQNIRHGNHIEVIEDVDESLLSCITLKLILQPLAENAIEHGFRHRFGQGVIRLSVKQNSNYILFIMEDNGVGIDSQEMRRRLSGEIVSTGYGINNIVQRLNLYFGDAFLFYYENMEYPGTRVTIAIPIVSSELNL
ncbi:histidine kinase [Paenibacillus sp. JSM ZJ436]|uniref:sensor histidine kinase n=1 Tax=Paenibacillus sp. JSM ZJ436 TaxID=3376190 RepID=UPI0037B2EE06